jgi:tripartite-type tricarboxylate transporter receptor subunit TctC
MALERYRLDVKRIGRSPTLGWVKHLRDPEPFRSARGSWVAASSRSDAPNRRLDPAYVESALKLRWLAAGVAIVASTAVRAESVGDFYKGKMLTVVTWQGPGTSYDSYARLIGRHMGKFIPGAPQFRVQLMAGGGGIIAANHLANIAPKDGTVLFMAGPGLVVEQALGLNKSLAADLRKFGWLGSLSASNQVLVTWHTSPTKDLKTAMQRETTVGATGVGSQSYQLPAFYNNVLGTKLKIVSGYSEASHIETAMERGELEGRGNNPWATYKSLKPHYVAQKLIVPIIQVGLKKEADLPDVPLLSEIKVSDGDRDAVAFMSRSSAIGRPLATTPDVPAERLAALVAAFWKVTADPEFIADIRKQNLELEPATGATLAMLVKEMIDLPEAVRERVKRATAPPEAK